MQYCCRSSRGSVDWNYSISFFRKIKYLSLLSWERGLKFSFSKISDAIGLVAPLVGAWIEIAIIRWSPDIKSSLLSWERGLKYLTNYQSANQLSRSSRGSVDWNSSGRMTFWKWLSRSSRGSVDWNYIWPRATAPIKVAPLVGAWIEISLIMSPSSTDFVAPLVGAWIEISAFWTLSFASSSLLSWERGLKYECRLYEYCTAEVAPLVGAWIEMGT